MQRGYRGGLWIARCSYIRKQHRNCYCYENRWTVVPFSHAALAAMGSDRRPHVLQTHRGDGISGLIHFAQHQQRRRSERNTDKYTIAACLNHRSLGREDLREKEDACNEQRST
ncbi:unnamed protein product [Ectocarpus sp. 12 AP-2014]